MKTALTFFALVGLMAAWTNVGEIIKDSTTKGWVFGVGLLTCVVCLVWAIAS